MLTATFYAYDTKTGRQIREATAAEIAAFDAAFPVRALSNPLVLDGVAIDYRVTGFNGDTSNAPLMW